jgi:predicted transcriptional regulator with HTH domain
MAVRTELVDKIIRYLRKIYPRAATASLISKESGVASCSADSWISSLLADRTIEIVGKKGRSNLYRLKK